MNFPTNISFRINSQSELDGFVAGLEAGINNLRDQNQDVVQFATILERVRYHDDKGIVEDVPDAYVEVAGRRLGAGDYTEMFNLFQQEVAGHKATVVLHRRDGLIYKAIQTRRGANR